MVVTYSYLVSHSMDSLLKLLRLHVAFVGHVKRSWYMTWRFSYAEMCYTSVGGTV